MFDFNVVGISSINWVFSNFGISNCRLLRNICLLFFNSSKPVLTENIFVDWPIRNLFSQQKVNIKKLTADISLKNLFVDHEILVVWMPRMS